MIFKCPVCGEKHSVPDNYDQSDYVCGNTSNRLHQKTFQDLKPNDQLSRNAYNFNSASTKEDVARAATVFPKKHEYKKTGQKQSIDKTNW